MRAGEGGERGGQWSAGVVVTARERREDEGSEEDGRGGRRAQINTEQTEGGREVHREAGMEIARTGRRKGEVRVDAVLGPWVGCSQL